jgi:hypothetical protein
MSVSSDLFMFCLFEIYEILMEKLNNVELELCYQLRITRIGLLILQFDLVKCWNGAVFVYIVFKLVLLEITE